MKRRRLADYSRFNEYVKNELAKKGKIILKKILFIRLHITDFIYTTGRRATWDDHTWGPSIEHRDRGCRGRGRGHSRPPMSVWPMMPPHIHTVCDPGTDFHKRDITSTRLLTPDVCDPSAFSSIQTAATK